jgi:hypothetical protein
MRHGSENTAAPRGVGDIIGLEVAAVMTRAGQTPAHGASCAPFVEFPRWRDG